jgi:heme-degrading monooxygenase HmoA
MHARVTLTHGSVAEIDTSIGRVRDVLPTLQKQHGFKGMYVLVDRQAGKGITFSLWETEADMKASEEAGGRARTQVTAGTQLERALSVTRSHFNRNACRRRGYDRVCNKVKCSVCDRQGSKRSQNPLAHSGRGMGRGAILPRVCQRGLPML